MTVVRKSPCYEDNSDILTHISLLTFLHSDENAGIM